MKKRSDQDVQNLVVTDGEQERGEHPIGRVVHISTHTHAFRGTLENVTPSYFVLAVGAVMVGDTGDVGAYTQAKGGSEESRAIKGQVLVPRGVAWILVME